MTDARTLDDLARELGRARAAHERRPDDAAAYTRMLEAQVAYLAAEGQALKTRAMAEQGRAAGLARALARHRLEGRDAMTRVMEAAQRAVRARATRGRQRRAGADVLPLLHLCEGAT